MKYFKELLINKEIGVLILSVFIFISGLMLLLLGLIIFNMGVIILGILIICVGYFLPVGIIKLDKNKIDNKVKYDNEKNNVIKNIKGIRLASDDEKQEYIMKKDKSKYLLNLLGKACISSILILVIISLTSFDSIYFALIIATGIFPIIIFEIAKIVSKNRAKQLMGTDVYIANCNVYDEKKVNRHHRYYYYLKITDGNYYIDRWFLLDNYNGKIKNVKLYVSNDIDLFDIIVDV